MNHSTVVGQYLDRDVFLASSRSLLDKLSPSVLAHTVVLYWLPQAEDMSDLFPHFQKIVASMPVVLFVAGPDANEAFDAILQHLSIEVPRSQIITKSSEAPLTECIDELLRGTWPSEERFDAWTNYLVIARDEDLERVRKSLVAAL